MRSTPAFVRVVFALLAALAPACSTRAPLGARPLVGARAPAASPLSEELNGLCARRRVELGIVGLRAAVIDDGQLVFHGGAGFADRERGLLTAPDTLFRLGSISKPVTAALVMQEVAAGRLELDADLRRYSPELSGKLAPITLRQVLSHTSGVRHYAPGRIDNSTKLRTTRESLELFVDDPLLFTPGEKYSYSTHAYTLAAHVLECVTRQPFERLVRERVAARGAPSLDCERLAQQKPARSKLYNKVEGAEPLLQLIPEDNSWKYAGGGMEATALDLARFGQLMLDDQLVERAQRDALWSPTRLNDGSKSNYGLGWSLDPESGLVSHTGSQQGCHCALLIDPQRRRVVAVMSNTLGGGAPALARELLAALD